ncbi:RNA-binding protein 33-like isoform X2 [Centruroides vittatus]|uniref:RNA-binding protein 33-like isoform X2 n=1 Tax=Centruroides vittatus TaxID=120091 RepID=UPI00350FE522
MDEDFLNDDCHLKEVDELEDLDIAEEEALLQISEEEALDDDNEIQFVDEEGNPLEVRDGDMELYEIHQYDNHTYTKISSDSQQDEDILEVEVDGEFDSFSQENVDNSFNSTESTRQVKIENSRKIEESLEQCEVSHMPETVKNEAEHLETEESEEENADNDDRHERFRSERANVISISAAKKRPDIPDNLDSVISAEEAAKVNEFLAREQERKNRYRKPKSKSKFGKGGLQHQQLQMKRPLITQMRSEIPVQPVYPTPHVNNNVQPSTSQQSSYTSHNPPRKILINPHFRGPRPSVSEESSYAPAKQSQFIRNSHSQHINSGRNMTPQIQQNLPPSSLQNMGPRFPIPQQGQYRMGLLDNRPPAFGGDRQFPHNQDMHFDQRNHPSSRANLECMPDMFRPPINTMPPACIPQNDSLLGSPPLQMNNTNIHRFQPPISNSWNVLTSQANMSQQHMPLHPAPPRQPMFEMPFRGPSMHQPSIPNPNFRDNNIPPPPLPQVVQMSNFQHQSNSSNPPSSFPPLHIPPPNHHSQFPMNPLSVQPNMPPPPPPPPPPPAPQQFRSQEFVPNMMPIQTTPFSNNARKDMYSSPKYNRNILQHPHQVQQSNVQNRMPSPQVQLSSPQRRYKAQMQRKRLNSDNKTSSLVKQQRIDNRKQRKSGNIGRKPIAQNSNIKEVPIVENLPPSQPAQPVKEAAAEIEEDEETKELRRKIEEQKKLREEILRRKEERRRMMATQRMKELQQRLKEQKQQQQQQQQFQQQPQQQQLQQQQQQQPQLLQHQKPVEIKNAISENTKEQTKLTVKQRIGIFNIMKQTPNFAPKLKKVVVLRKKFQQLGQNTQKNPVIIQTKAQQNTPIQSTQANIIQQRIQNPQNRTVAPPGTKINQINTIKKKIPVTKDQRIVIPRGQTPQTQRQVIQVNTNGGNTTTRKVLTPNCNRNAVRMQRMVNLIGTEGQGDAPSAQQRNLLTQKTQTVLIENLTASTNEAQLSKLCSSVGPVESIQLQRKDRKAVIKFKDPVHASNFQKKYQRHMLDLSMIQVSLYPA